MMRVCVLQPHSDLRLFVSTRCILHHHGIIPVEGDCHHAGELSASLHPQVPAQALLPTQLLQTDLLKELEEPPALLAVGKHYNVPVLIQQSCTCTRESVTDSSPLICSEQFSLGM